MGCIYKIYNTLNNKVYIGKTTRTAEERFSDHIALLEQGAHYSKKMQRDYNINKEAFRVKKIYSVLRDEDLSGYEKHFIRINKSVELGYNTLHGG